MQPFIPRPAQKKPEQKAPQEAPQQQVTPPPRNNGQAVQRKIFPTQNLLDKYRSAGSFFNSENTLRDKLGMPKMNPSTNQPDGESLLADYLKKQSDTFNDLDDKLKTQLGLQDFDELESQVRENLGDNYDDEFLSELLRRILSSGL